MKRRTFTLVALLALSAVTTAFAADAWHSRLKDQLPLLGHRNWIVVADSAYPLQTAPGIETVCVEADQLEVVKGVLAELEKRGQLSNTLVVVTADNGMPFPRAKGNEYEDSNHLPLAVMWPRGIKAPDRVVKDYVSFIDFAPTFIEVAGLKWAQTGMAAAAGRSLTEFSNPRNPAASSPRATTSCLGRSGTMSGGRTTGDIPSAAS